MKIREKITCRIIELKQGLGASKTRYILCACGALFGLIILIFAYKPLITRLHNTSNRLCEMQFELLNQHTAIAEMEKSHVKVEMIQRKDVPLAIDKLTEKGKKIGLHFSSISPSEMQKTEQTGILKLPISFIIESEYENLGQFLAYVEDFSHQISEVESLCIHPKKDGMPKLSVELTLNLYVKEKNES